MQSNKFYGNFVYEKNHKNFQRDSNGENSLYFAIRSKNADVVREIRQKGGDLSESTLEIGLWWIKFHI